MKVRFEYTIIVFLMSFLFGNDHNVLLALIICAIIHETGHLICAKILKIKIREIVIDIGGAKIYPYSNTYPYSHELLLSFSGPLANIICVYIIHFISNESRHLQNFSKNLENGALSFIELVLIFSLLQSFLNLLPISNLDGGRILKCILCILFSQRIGEIFIRITTIIFSIILWIISVYFLVGSGSGISLFVFSICMFFKIFESGE